MERNAPIYGSDTAVNGDSIIDSSTPVGDGWLESRRSRVTRGGLHTDCHLLRGHTSAGDDRAIRYCVHYLGTHRGCCRTLADTTELQLRNLPILGTLISGIQHVVGLRRSGAGNDQRQAGDFSSKHTQKDTMSVEFANEFAAANRLAQPELQESPIRCKCFLSRNQ